MLSALRSARRFVPAAWGYRVVGGGKRAAGHIIFRVNTAISSNPGPYAIRPIGRCVTESLTGGKQAVTAACFVRRVISAYR